MAGNDRARQTPLLGTRPAGRRTADAAVAWSSFQSAPSPWRLQIRDVQTGTLVDRLVGNRRYALTARPAKTTIAGHRYVYAFVIDSAGRTILLFPRSGSVENRFPTTREIHLGRFAGAPPYGVDTFHLLSTDEPLPNPWRIHPPAGTGWSIERRSLRSTPQSSVGRVY